MDEIRKQKEFDRAIRRAIKKKARKQMWIWLAASLLVSILLSFAVHYMPVWYDMLVRYQDPVYRPMDIERQYNALDRERGGIKQY
jgi:hypothetical protein